MKRHALLLVLAASLTAFAQPQPAAPAKGKPALSVTLTQPGSIEFAVREIGRAHV